MSDDPTPIFTCPDFVIGETEAKVINAIEGIVRPGFYTCEIKARITNPTSRGLMAFISERDPMFIYAAVALPNAPLKGSDPPWRPGSDPLDWHSFESDGVLSTLPPAARIRRMTEDMFTATQISSRAELLGHRVVTELANRIMVDMPFRHDDVESALRSAWVRLHPKRAT